MCSNSVFMMVVSIKVCSFARLFAKLPRSGDSEVTFAVAATCYYHQSNHSKVETISLSALPKDTTSKLADLSLH